MIGLERGRAGGPQRMAAETEGLVRNSAASSANKRLIIGLAKAKEITGTTEVVGCAGNRRERDAVVGEGGPGRATVEMGRMQGMGGVDLFRDGRGLSEAVWLLLWGR